MTKFRFEVIFPTGSKREYAFDIRPQDLIDESYVYEIENADEAFIEKLEEKIAEIMPKSMNSIKRRITRELKELGYRVKWRSNKLVILEVEEEVDNVEEDFKTCLEDALYNALLLVVEKAIKELRR